MKEKSESCAGFGLPKMLLQADLFPAPIPQFNSRGKKAVKTYFGGLISLIMIYLFFLFAVVKFLHLVTRHNPQIVEYDETNAFDAADEYSPGENNSFMIAVGFQHYLTGEPLNDPRYVKWINTYQGQEGSSFVFEQANLMQPCTEEDFKKFYPPDKNAESAVEKLKREGVLFCLDEDLVKTQALRGMMNAGDNRYIDLISMPCH